MFHSKSRSVGRVNDERRIRVAESCRNRSEFFRLNVSHVEANIKPAFPSDEPVPAIQKSLSVWTSPRFSSQLPPLAASGKEVRQIAQPAGGLITPTTEGRFANEFPAAARDRFAPELNRLRRRRTVNSDLGRTSPGSS